MRILDYCCCSWLPHPPLVLTTLLTPPPSPPNQGLLSGHGMRILDYCCGVAADRPDQPIDLWSSVEEEVRN